MKFLGTAQLQITLPQKWSALDEGDVETIRAAVLRQPTKMRRIHDLLILTKHDFEIRDWLYQGDRGGRPIDLLTNDDGVSHLDLQLVEQYLRGAPREIFDVCGKMEDRALAGDMILRLLLGREGALPDFWGGLHDPMKSRHTPLNNQEGRLAAAVRSYVGEFDDEISREILRAALRDDLAVIKIAALEAGGWLSGYSDVYETVCLMRHDTDPMVRIAAARCLATRIEIAEIAMEVAEYLDDSDIRVRVAAIECFKGRDLPEEILYLLVRSTFDVEPVAEIARRIVPQSVVNFFLMSLAANVLAGDEVAAADRAIVMGSGLTDIAPKTTIWTTILKTLEEQGPASAESARKLLKELSQRPDLVTPDLLEHLGRSELFAGNAVLADEVAMLAAKIDDDAGWPLWKSYLVMPVDELRSEAQVRLVNRVLDMAKRNQAIVNELIDIVVSNDTPHAARQHLIWILRQLGPKPPILEVLRGLALNKTIHGTLARTALASIRDLLSPAEESALMEVAVVDGGPLVQEYAYLVLAKMDPLLDRSKVSPDIIAAYVAERRTEDFQRPATAREAKVIQLKDARARREARKHRQVPSDE